MSKANAHSIPAGLHVKTRIAEKTRSLLRKLADMESSALREDIDEVAIDRPIYVTALARSGTTIVTEILHDHPSTTSHHYADFPFVELPYWRNWLHQRSRFSKPEAVERAHKDRILVTEDSPEAVEEVLWMQFFDQLHAAGESHLLTEQDRDPAFDRFYRDHIRKLLMIRNAKRYLAKGNYNVARLRYIQSLFPDARFVIPVRHPIWHIASLMKQHRFFNEGNRVNPKIAPQLAASGHFEFGALRHAINFGDHAAHQAIETAWAQGDEVRGWALYWRSVYGHLCNAYETDVHIKDAVCFTRFETLCADPGTEIDRILDHCRLDANSFQSQRADFIDRLAPPDYYRPEFSAQEMDVIRDLCEPLTYKFGYTADDWDTASGAH